MTAIAAPTFGYTKSGKTYTTDGSQIDVSAAIVNASSGDVVTIPAGTFTWGASGTSVAVNKPITLMGSGTGTTVINLDSTGPTFGSGGVIGISAAATVRNFTINGTSTSVTAFAVGTSNDWRITDIVFNGGTAQAYFCIINSVYGLIDNCTVTGGNLQSELIFARGLSNAWQTASAMGSSANVFIEDCTFGGDGYVCDANANAHFVVRYCTINGTNKIDGHGLASNTPPRSVRHMEIYGNHWTAPAGTGTWMAMELRGGTGMVFDNVSDNVSTTSNKFPFIELNEFGCLNLWANFSNQYQTPINYPIADQIGVGEDPKAAASEPYYLWNNVRGGSDWGIFQALIPAAAITLYQTQTGNPAATFTMADVIAADRDYFKQTVGGTFDGSSGVGRGTKAQMLAITPTKTGVAFWVTDEADWNAVNAGPDGQLYVWNGSAWVLKYTPYTYPHPLRRPRAPTNLRLSELSLPAFPVSRTS